MGLELVIQALEHTLAFVSLACQPLSAVMAVMLVSFHLQYCISLMCITQEEVLAWVGILSRGVYFTVAEDFIRVVVEVAGFLMLV